MSLDKCWRWPSSICWPHRTVLKHEYSVVLCLQGAGTRYCSSTAAPKHVYTASKSPSQIKFQILNHLLQGSYISSWLGLPLSCLLLSTFENNARLWFYQSEQPPLLPRSLCCSLRGLHTPSELGWHLTRGKKNCREEEPVFLKKEISSETTIVQLSQLCHFCSTFQHAH